MKILHAGNKGFIFAFPLCSITHFQSHHNLVEANARMFKPQTTLPRLWLFFFLLTACSLSAQDWEFKNEKEGVKVYYRQKADIFELKLTASIETSLSGIVQLFNQVERYPQWGYKIAESRLLEKISETECIYYTKFDFPWPLADRDVIMRSKLEQDPHSKVVTSVSTAEPWRLAEYADVVRIKDAHTRWVMHPNNSGWLYLEYFVYSDPGGGIPDWAVNMAIDVGPRETVKRIRDVLKEPAFRRIRLAHIKE